MPKIVPYLEYREHCTKQGRHDEVKPLTRKQKKALRQHREATGRLPKQKSH